jgi:hypothetical protein
MKQMSLKYPILSLILLCFAQITMAAEDHLLFGTWSSKCAANDSGNFIIETFHFVDEAATYSVKTYSDSVCKKPISTLTTYRSYNLGDSDSADIRKLDYVFKSVTMTYKNKSAIADANKSPGYYGFTDWQLDKAKDVSGLKLSNSSSPERTDGEKFYTIVKIDKNKLYMGDYSSGAGTSDKSRLSAIYKIPFIKEDK